MNRESKLGAGDYISIEPNLATRDSFGHLRVSQPYTNFDSKFLYDKLPLLWDEAVTGGSSTHDPDNACINLTVSANGHSVIRQTKQRFNYKSCKSQLFLFTGVLGAGVSQTVKRVGAFDDDNGLF